MISPQASHQSPTRRPKFHLAHTKVEAAAVVVGAALALVPVQAAPVLVLGVGVDPGTLMFPHE